MNIDFHSHVKLAKSLPVNEKYLQWMFEECKKTSLDSICLTEHFNTKAFQDLYELIYDNSEKDGDCLIFNGLKIFPGMEVDILEGAHILVLGKFEDIIDLNEKLEDHKTKETFLTFDDLMDLLEPYDLIIGGAHPFRSNGAIPSLTKDQLEKLDFIDLNGKDTALEGKKNIEKIEAFARKISKPILCGSDTHQAFQYEAVYNEFENDVNTFEDLREEIENGRYKLKISATIEDQVKSATLLKKALKAIHALGGDYIDVLTNN